MKIITCIKQVYDLDIVLENDWIVDNNKVDIHYANRIINPFDETALEMMLSIKDENPSIITEAITIGDKSSDDILRKALALKTDTVTRIDLHHEKLRSPNDTASLLYNQITSKNVDLVLCGKQSDIRNYGQTAQILAAKLDWPCFTDVYEIKYIDKKYTLKRLSGNNEQIVTIKGPLVISVIQSENKYLRMATLRDMLFAKKKEIYTISNEVALKQLSESKIKNNLHSLYIEKQHKECKYLPLKQENNIYTELSNLIKEKTGKVIL